MGNDGGGGSAPVSEAGWKSTFPGRTPRTVETGADTSTVANPGIVLYVMPHRNDLALFPGESVGEAT